MAIQFVFLIKIVEILLKKQIKQLNQNEKFWHGWNNTSIGNLLLIKNWSKVITVEEKNFIDEILSKIDFTDFNKIYE